MSKIYVYDYMTIKWIRTSKNLTQDYCAKRADVAYQQWQRWESGESTPSATALGDIALALDITPTDLFRTIE